MSELTLSLPQTSTRRVRRIRRVAAKPTLASRMVKAYAVMSTAAALWLWMSVFSQFS